MLFFVQNIWHLYSKYSWSYKESSNVNYIILTLVWGIIYYYTWFSPQNFSEGRASSVVWEEGEGVESIIWMDINLATVFLYFS